MGLRLEHKYAPPPSWLLAASDITKAARYLQQSDDSLMIKNVCQLMLNF